MSDFVKQQTNKRNINFLFILKPNSKSPQRYIQLLCGDIYLYNQNDSHKQALYAIWLSFHFISLFNVFHKRYNRTNAWKRQNPHKGRIVCLHESQDKPIIKSLALSKSERKKSVGHPPKKIRQHQTQDHILECFNFFDVDRFERNN